MTDVNANRQRLDEITKEIEDTKRRLQELIDDKNYMILQEITQQVDLLCAKFQMTLPQVIELLKTEDFNRAPIQGA